MLPDERDSAGRLEPQIPDQFSDRSSDDGERLMRVPREEVQRLEKRWKTVRLRKKSKSKK